MRTLILFFVIVTFTSCNNERHRLEKKLDGVWGIEKLLVKEKDYTNSLYVNTFVLDSKTKNAMFHASLYFEQDFKAHWELISSDNIIDSISINSNIKIYNGRFKFSFSKRSNGQPCLELNSSKVYIKAYQLFK